MRHPWALGLVCVVAVTIAACARAPIGPSGSASIAAPFYVAPANGDSLASSSTIVLTVRNAIVTGDSTVTYHFEVALDAAFAQTVLTSDVPEDPGGQTSFPTGRLTPSHYFWRVRASAGGDTGAFTQPISFTVKP